MLRTPPGPGALVQSAIDPLVATATLALAVSFFGGTFDGACLILALLVFAMTFPGSLARVSRLPLGYVHALRHFGAHAWHGPPDSAGSHHQPDDVAR